MNQVNPFGLYLYRKEHRDQAVLKDLLQLLKTNSPGKVPGFAYVEAQNSLLPSLSLWENLQLVVGHSSWKEFGGGIRPEFAHLFRIITRPDLKSSQAESWEKFTISLLKGLCTPGHLLIDINEELLTPLMIKNFKETVLSITQEKQIYLASASSALWLDCAHSVISKEEYRFVIEKMDENVLKRHWAA
jgi:hypothetical protein